ncbi:protein STRICTOSIDINE SYNTHASE-LIKE 2-like isoform X3 [Miscanthus floridulus]|uniref:protein STRICTOSIDINE SYNTHASE-LIKE 2-like isoform X3 n=1 Tax=Miscanthus floridulus TaxID=154761 RepID=UPI00345A7282
MMRARGEVALAALLAAAALMLSSLDSRSDVRMLEIGDGDAELLPLLDGAVGPESLVFAGDVDGDGGDSGPFTGVSDGRVLRWVAAERRWAEHSSAAPDLCKLCGLGCRLDHRSWPHLRTALAGLSGTSAHAPAAAAMSRVTPGGPSPRPSPQRPATAAVFSAPGGRLRPRPSSSEQYTQMLR